MNTENKKSNTNKFGKQVYRSPKLSVYGDIRELTLGSNVFGGIVDSPNGPNKSKA